MWAQNLKLRIRFSALLFLFTLLGGLQASGCGCGIGDFNVSDSPYNVDTFQVSHNNTQVVFRAIKEIYNDDNDSTVPDEIQTFLKVAPISGGSLKELSTKFFYDFWISPDDKFVFFNAVDQEKVKLFRVPLTGGNQNPINIFDSQGESLSVKHMKPSKNGSFVVFRQDHEIYVVPSSGGQATLLSQNADTPIYVGPFEDLPEIKSSFAITSDNEYIIFIQWEEDKDLYSLVKISKDGENVETLSHIENQDIDLDVEDFKLSSDGSWVLFRTHSDVLYSVDLSSGQLQEIASDVNNNDYEFTPNQLAVVYHNEDQLFSNALEGQDEILLGSCENGCFFKISPNNQQVVFLTRSSVSYNETKDEIYSVSIEGGPAVLLAEETEETTLSKAFSISEDSQRVYLTFVQNYETYQFTSVPITGGQSFLLSEMDYFIFSDAHPPSTNSGGYYVVKIGTLLIDDDALYSIPIQGGQAVLLSH